MPKLLAITAGDASGVGCEILLKAYKREEIHVPFVAFGDLAAFEFYNQLLDYQVPLHGIAAPGQYQEGALNVVDARILRRQDITVGKIQRQSGHAAWEYVAAATRATLAGEVGAIVTLPMNKEATQMSHADFTGHTELIGQLCGARDVTIMLVCDQLITTHVSTHVSLATAITRVKKERILTILQLTCAAVEKLRPQARIAVAGLNPHAGENGLFGEEEILEIRPAIAAARRQGLAVEGPFASDTLFYKAVREQQYDAVVCMYHDQGHIPSKLLDFEGAVNITLGLPIVRTSVDHGTAFDIAGQGKAATTSFIRAVELAGQLALGSHQGIKE